MLVPAMPTIGGTGMRLTRNATGRLVRRKLLRMRVVGALDLLVLVPCALYLGPDGDGRRPRHDQLA